MKNWKALNRYTNAAWLDIGRVEMWRRGLGRAYPLTHKNRCDGALIPINGRVLRESSRHGRDVGHDCRPTPRYRHLVPSLTLAGAIRLGYGTRAVDA